jgi:hypothetical protein
MLLIQKKKEDCGKEIIAFSGIQIVDIRGNIIKKNFADNQIKQGRIFNYIISRSCMIPRDFVFKRQSYFEVGGYDFALTTHEDWDLKIRLSLKFEFYYTSISGIAYRRHTLGLSSIPFKDRTVNLWKVFRKNFPLAKPDQMSHIRQAFIKFMLDRANNYKRISIKSGF